MIFIEFFFFGVFSRHELSRMLAKNVIEILSPLNGCYDSDSEDGALNSSPLCMTNDYHGVDTLTFQKQNVLQGGDCEGLSCDDDDEDVDAGLRRRLKDDEERVIHLFKELEKYRVKEQRLHDRVRELAEQNVSLQREV